MARCVFVKSMVWPSDGIWLERAMLYNFKGRSMHTPVPSIMTAPGKSRRRLYTPPASSARDRHP